MRKFELVENSKIEVSGKTLFRIKALISFANVKEGDLGGYVEKEENVAHKGNAWVYGNAWVCGDAWVYGDAWVSNDADYTTIKGFGTEYRNTTFFKCRDGSIKVSCGCFLGTIAQFREQVKNTRTGKIAKEYLMIADLMEYHFAVEIASVEQKRPRSSSDSV